MKTSEAAHGKWRYILTNLGIKESFLKGKHVSCPLCGGKDRFRFDDRTGSGDYFCNKCGAGKGFKLLMKFNQWTFAEAAREIDEFLGNKTFKELPPEPKINYDSRMEALQKILNKSKKVERGDGVYKYLNNRGINQIPSSIGICSSLFNVEAKKSFEAMVCRIVDAQGKTVSLHRTFLKDGKKAPVKNPRKICSPIGTIRGCAIRLFKEKELLGISEGIETSLAVQELFKMPCWAVMNAGNLEAFEPPETVRDIVIYADNDLNKRGEEAANILGDRLTKQGGRERF